MDQNAPIDAATRKKAVHRTVAILVVVIVIILGLFLLQFVR
jgi:preprotein translocase subunit SecE